MRIARRTNQRNRRPRATRPDTVHAPITVTAARQPGPTHTGVILTVSGLITIIGDADITNFKNFDSPETVIFVGILKENPGWIVVGFDDTRDRTGERIGWDGPMARFTSPGGGFAPYAYAAVVQGPPV